MIVTHYDKETVENARKVDILTYLEACEPENLVRMSSRTYRLRSHDSLKISSGKWYWWSRSIGGSNAIDYLIHVKGMPFAQAVETILSNNLADKAYCPPPTCSPKILKLPPKHENADRVRYYLESRGIDDVISGGLIHAGRIYENHLMDKNSGKTFINAVFIGVDNSGSPKYASIRGIDSDYKGEAVGSDKRYSFSIPALHSNKNLHLFEGVMDLLSYATLIRMDGQELRGEHLLSLGGVNLPKKDNEFKMPLAIEGFLSQHREIEKVYLHLDNDVAGRFASDAIIGILADKFACTDEPPKSGKDYNDYLRHCRSPTANMRGGSQKIAQDISR
jgi:hypothetical protein